MKKYFIIALMSTAASITAKAEISFDKFYVKAETGVIGFKKINEGGKALDFFRTGFKNLAPNFGIGLGCYLNEKLRAEVMLSHFTNANQQISKAVKIGQTPAALNIGSKINHRGVHNNIMVAGYLNIAEISSAKLFLGAGVGYSKIKERITIKPENGLDSYAVTSSKAAPSYMLALGTNFRITEEIIGELMYSWRELGKSKIVKDEYGNTYGGNGYKGHNLSVALRFDI